MKREDLKKQGLTDEQIEAVMKLHGETYNALKVDLESKVAEITSLNKTVEEANNAIKGFKDLNIDEIKKSAEEWKSKYEQDIKAKETEILTVKRNHAIELELGKVNVKNPTLFKKALDFEKITYNDGKIGGLVEQVEELKKTDAYLFNEVTPIQKGGLNPTLSQEKTYSSEEVAIFNAMGVKPPK